MDKETIKLVMLGVFIVFLLSGGWAVITSAIVSALIFGAKVVAGLYLAAIALGMFRQFVVGIRAKQEQADDVTFA